jgi:LCP family protein required for cell wall assembly
MSYAAKHLGAPKHAVLKAVAGSTALVLAVLAGSVFFTFRHLEGNINKIPAFENILADRPTEAPAETEGESKPLNILIMGSDSRAGQKAVLGSTPGLSDTTILLHLSADRKRAYGISVPRDLMVARPACKAKDGSGISPATDAAQWNEAFALGGEPCTIAQFEQMTGVRVHHFITVDFNGFKDMVDALGGVPVCLPEPVNDPIGKIYLRAGSYDITGEEALGYVRVRHGIGSVDTGDIGRMKRQQTFLASMVNKAISAKTMLNPHRLLSFLNAATRSLSMDEEFADVKELYALAQDVRGIGLDKVQFLSMPFESYAPDPNRLAPAPEADLLWRQLREDAPLARRLTEGATKASEAKPTKRPGGAGSSPSPSPTRSAEAAEVGLCA